MIPAFLLKPFVPWAAAGVAVVGCIVLYALWDGAAKGEKAAKLESALYAADADRWEDAAKLERQATGQVIAAYKLQTERVKEGRAKEQALAERLAAASRNNLALRDRNDQLARDLAAETEAAPGDVREVGPIVGRRAGELFK